MQTPWDWITVFGFAGLVTLLLQRSSEDEPRDKLWQYAPPALACAIANYVGNKGMPAVAIAILVAGLAYTFMVLKVQLPWGRR